jgi:hypothetical protein
MTAEESYPRLAMALLLVTGLAAPAYAEQKKSDQELMASAMSAAPKTVAESATIVDMAPDGTMKTLRKGTNGFTCMPDNPTSPGPDPMCLDANAMEWAHAWLKHEAPPDKVGFVYMLAGGSDGSNTDPYAQKPEPDNHWIATPSHVMVVGPAVKSMPGYPQAADPDTSKPYVMWAGTPYAHLMIPVR